MEVIMSMHSTTLATAQGLSGRFWTRDAATRLARWWVAYAQWRIKQQTLATLANMSDRELKDIGLTRTDIPAVVRGESVHDHAIIRYL
jgi:uncharacterized protein YjiS (DUF1127 family)